MRAHYLLLLLCLTIPWNVGLAGDDGGVELTVTESFLEMHTGPGRGFPLFYVAPRNSRIEVLKRRTDWYKIRMDNGKEGWVQREQLISTLTQAGVQMSFRDILLEDYLSHRLEFGLAAGTLDRDIYALARASFRIQEHMAVEFSMGQATGRLSNSNVYMAGIQVLPFSGEKHSPFFTLGIGRLDNNPRETLIGDKATRSVVGAAGVGLRSHWTRRFMVRLDAQNMAVIIGDDRNEELLQLSGGISFFF